jgi:hypothetical protein
LISGVCCLLAVPSGLPTIFTATKNITFFR